MRFIAIMFLLWIGNGLRSQTYTSRNNYSGDWEDQATWNYTWSAPTHIVNGTNLNIYGYVTIHGSLILQGNSSTITVYDTLVILGNLSLGNNINLAVGNNGVLIIRGGLNVVNNTDIFTNGYVVVCGDFTNTSNQYEGSFWTTGDPSNVFIAGIVPDVDDWAYPVLDCDNPVLETYANSGCAFGNTSDLLEDPIYNFYQTLCRAGVTSGSNSPLCEGQSLNLTCSGGTSYLWTGPGGFNSNSQNPDITNPHPNASGNYLVQIIVPGCKITDTVKVLIYENPVLTASVDNPVCEGQKVQFISSGAEEYYWTGPDSFNSTLPSPVIDPVSLSQAGRYILSGTSSGCSDSDTIYLTVNPIPAVTATAESPVCEGSQVKFTASGATAYQWSGPRNFSSVLAEPTITGITVAASGNYILKGTVSGCTGSDTVIIQVNPLPHVRATSNSPLCEGEILILDADGGSYFLWTGPSGFISEIPDPRIANAAVNNSGIYMVKAWTREGCSDSASSEVIINSYPSAFAGQDKTLENSYETELEAESEGFETGKWSVKSGTGTFSNDELPFSSVIGLSDGPNVLKWTTANGRCYASDEVIITVIPLFIPNVITPNNDGRNDFLIISAIGENAELIIFNRQGITEYSSGNYQNDWNGVNYSGRELPDDTYYYVLKLGNGTIRKGSVLIKRK